MPALFKGQQLVYREKRPSFLILAFRTALEAALQAVAALSLPGAVGVIHIQQGSVVALVQ